MKKLFIVLLALCLFVVPAMAQTQDNPQLFDVYLKKCFHQNSGKNRL